jgi:peptide/nickel transport system substrate-binding protein
VKKEERASMRTRIRGSLAVASLAVLALTAAACGSTSKTPGSTGAHGLAEIQDGIQGVNPGTGAPHRGGTLNMLGDGDVDWMDYNASYYTIGYLA